MPEEHARISMEEQRRIHTRALNESGPPAAGETKAQEAATAAACCDG